MREEHILGRGNGFCHGPKVEVIMGWWRNRQRLEQSKQGGEKRQTSSLLGFTLLHLPDYIIYKWKVCSNPASGKCIGTIFPTAFAHFMSLCHWLIKRGQGFRGLTRVLQVLLWVKCYQTALHATEKSFMKGRFSQCSKLHCCLILRNCYSRFQQPPPWSVSSHQHWGKTSMNKKITTHWTLR